MKTAQEILNDASEDVSIDAYLKRDPATLKREDIEALVLKLRAQRAQFIKSEEKKKAKKEGLEDNDE